ncbi:G-protein coupled receptor 52-like [Parasteatoda tepidariorum]|uniref:G-protein coupled receptor 52-like n=1 Tax=Parasteatoda tepidariorum TaxID=114398 RepID=UPI001C719BCC|nr:G-protein coupled receptor 52-like [Parasteatoda tepidariorum]
MNFSSISIDEDYYTLEKDIVAKDHIEFISINKIFETALAVALCISSTTSNLIVICSIFCVSSRTHVLDFYIMSITTTNLLITVVVIPFSIAAKSDLLGVYSFLFCSISGYLHVSLSAVYMYTFMWMSVDRYLARRKSCRYDVIQTRTRCKCWILFSWVMATCLCCPPLIGDSKGHFYAESFICLLNIRSMLPYCITLGCLVLIPSISTLCFTYFHIFTTPDMGVKDEVAGFNSDHIATFMVTVGFNILWTPWGVLRILELISSKILANPTSRFWLLFLGEMHTLWTPIALLSWYRRCQTGLRLIFRCCIKSQTTVPL